ncbi:HVO_A0114 family putative DNA-binding protein [Limnobacter parvus]|uniref:DNA-binding protein n=1 Tax=Limnobacter parvus TaxID=2939690 RepID=A0ABT1XGH0_9BURK|nr:DNA-binding protein [Limnobacter parvus]MCR2745397.1 DNA-binding protein [Limnobacter parvus]
MKAIVEVLPKGSLLNGLLKSARNLDTGKSVSGDYRLTFESSKLLLSELTAARIALLEELRIAGPLSVYGLAKRIGRNYSNVHSDVAKLIEHGLVARFEDGKKIYVPFDSVEIRFTLNATNY